MYKTNKEIEELYQENEKLVFATVQRRFGNPAYRIQHGLDEDDITQFGRMGLLKACQTYDSTKGTSFQSHAINNIVWSITAEAKRYSLGNINSRTNELADRVSMDISMESESGEPQTLHDLLADEDDSFNVAEVNYFIDTVKSEISEDVGNLIKMRVDGMSFDEIAQELGVSKQAVQQRLRRNKKKIIDLYQVS